MSTTRSAASVRVMTDDLPLRFYLHDALRRRAEAGGHNFINLISEIAENARFRVEFHTTPLPLRVPDVHSLYHMEPPANARGLVFRKVYHYPFWQIDQTSERWHWDVAKAQFDPTTVSNDAERFYRFWQKRLFEAAPQDTLRDGFVYVPLQGRLTRHRSFQKCSPLDMIRHCLTHLPDRKIIATLHPKEEYTASERAKLDVLARKHPNLEIATGDMVHYLQTCDFVVTENSSAAFNGFFFGKPALLFAGIDFHHIAVKADMDDLQTSFDRVAGHAPDYAAYVWWFWQSQSINAGKDDARDKIAARLRRFGWPIE